MAKKISWNAQKKELWHMDIKELQEKLQQLEKEKMKMEMTARGFGGDMRVPMSIKRIGNQPKHPITLRDIRHRIACIKTILTVKLKPQIKN